MKLDRWTHFNLGRSDQQLFESFASPAGERSLIKDVPIQCLDQVKQAIRRAEALSDRKMRVIYRGSRNRFYGQATTWRQDADRFAVYWR